MDDPLRDYLRLKYLEKSQRNYKRLNFCNGKRKNKDKEAILCIFNRVSDLWREGAKNEKEIYPQEEDRMKNFSNILFKLPHDILYLIGKFIRMKNFEYSYMLFICNIFENINDSDLYKYIIPSIPKRSQEMFELFNVDYLQSKKDPGLIVLPIDDATIISITCHIVRPEENISSDEYYNVFTLQYLFNIWKHIDSVILGENIHRKSVHSADSREFLILCIIGDNFNYDMIHLTTIFILRTGNRKTKDKIKWNLGLGYS